MIRTLIVDDNADLRDALKRIIDKTSDIVVGGEAADGMETLSKVEEQEWDVVLLDITLPGMNGLEVLKRIKSQKPDLRVLMLSVHPEKLYAVPALRAGASGYLTKDRAVKELADAIRKVSRGGYYLSPSVADQLGIESADDC